MLELQQLLLDVTEHQQLAQIKVMSRISTASSCATCAATSRKVVRVAKPRYCNLVSAPARPLFLGKSDSGILEAHIREWCELTGARVPQMQNSNCEAAPDCVPCEDLFQTTLVYENFLMEGVGGSWLEAGLHLLQWP